MQLDSHMVGGSYPLTDLWYKGVRFCFLPPAAREVWQETDAERGIGWLKVDGAEAATAGVGTSGHTFSIFNWVLMATGYLTDVENGSFILSTIN